MCRHAHRCAIVGLKSSTLRLSGNMSKYKKIGFHCLKVTTLKAFLSSTFAPGATKFGGCIRNGLRYYPESIFTSERVRCPCQECKNQKYRRATRFGGSIGNSLKHGLRCYHFTERFVTGERTWCDKIVYINKRGIRRCPYHGELKCGRQKNQWRYCELPWGHSGDCEFERVPLDGGDDCSMYGPE